MCAQECCRTGINKRVEPNSATNFRRTVGFTYAAALKISICKTRLCGCVVCAVRDGVSMCRGILNKVWTGMFRILIRIMKL